MARKYHPDLNKGDKLAEAKFKQVGESYEILSDSSKRKEYDEENSFHRSSFNSQRSGFSSSQGFTSSQRSGGYKTSQNESYSYQDFDFASFRGKKQKTSKKEDYFDEDEFFTFEDIFRQAEFGGFGGFQKKSKRVKKKVVGTAVKVITHDYSHLSFTDSDLFSIGNCKYLFLRISTRGHKIPILPCKASMHCL